MKVPALGPKYLITGKTADGEGVEYNVFTEKACVHTMTAMSTAGMQASIYAYSFKERLRLVTPQQRRTWIVRKHREAERG